MKKPMVWKIILVAVLCGSTAAAQDSLSVIGKFIDGHSWTMDFGIASNLTLVSFKGSAISLSHYISDHQKYRLGVSTYLSSNSGDQSGNQYDQDTLSSRSTGNSDNNSNSVQITFQYITYATPKAQTSIYFGIGPVVGVSWSQGNSESNSQYVDDYQNRYASNQSSTMYSVGMLCSFGVEWFFSEHISVHAEYGVAAQYNWNKQEQTNSYKYNVVSSGGTINTYKSSYSTSSSGWSLSGQNVLFGLSVNY